MRNLNTVKSMRRDINVFCNELEQMKEEIIDKIDDLPNEMRKMLRDEMSGLMHHANKDSRFQSFIDDINDRNLLKALETSLAKDDVALDTFFCYKLLSTYKHFSKTFILLTFLISLNLILPSGLSIDLII